MASRVGGDDEEPQMARIDIEELLLSSFAMV